jgi:hypothetical protein
LRSKDHSEVGVDPGVLGCSVVMCNVGQGALAACSRLGEGLAYAGARLPNGHDGAPKWRRAIPRDHERYSPECVESEFSIWRFW